MTTQIQSRRERLRRAAEDAERLYRARMHSPDGPTIADDHRIDGILTLDLPDALGFVDKLISERDTSRAALANLRDTVDLYVNNDVGMPEIAEAMDVAFAALYPTPNDG